MQFTAVVDGRPIRYDQAATFVVEKRVGRKYEIVASKTTIERAVEKYRRVHQQGPARLMQCVNGRVKRLLSGR